MRTTARLAPDEDLAREEFVARWGPTFGPFLRLSEGRAGTHFVETPLLTSAALALEGIFGRTRWR